MQPTPAWGGWGGCLESSSFPQRGFWAAQLPVLFSMLFPDPCGEAAGLPEGEIPGS